MPRSYAIIGTGALGGYYGSRLVEAGADVHFLLHGDFEHVKREGLRVEAKYFPPFHAPVKAYGSPEDLPPCDVVAICLKTTSNDLLPSILPRLLKPDGVALVLQNGLGMEDVAAALAGPDRVMGGLCFLCSNKVGPGHIVHLDYGGITLGEYDPAGKARGITARLRAVASDFERGGIPITLHENLLTARWHKLVWNVPYNALTVILDTTTDTLMRDPHMLSLVDSLMREVQQLAAACGHAIGDDFVRKMQDDTIRMKPYRPSMMIDHELKRPMEVEAIYGNALRAGERSGAAAPRIETIYRMLKFLDARNQAARRSCGHARPAVRPL
jgi:2-dehydropantoate 2-reductase